MREYLLKQPKATCVLFSIACKINLGLVKNNGNPGGTGGVALALEIRAGGGITVIQEIWVGGGCDLQRITGYLAEAYIETHKVQFDSTW